MTADAVREALERIESECGNRGDLAYDATDVDAIREFILDLTNEADRLAALAGAAPVAWQYERHCLCVGGWHDWVSVVSEREPTGDGEIVRNVRPLFTHAPAKAREDSCIDDDGYGYCYPFTAGTKLTELVAAAEGIADFSWSAMKADCMEAAEECNGRIERLRAALATFAEGE